MSATAKVFRGHEDWVTAVAFDPEGRRIASASADRTVRTWNIETGESERVFGPFEAPVFGLIVLPDGSLVSGGLDGSLRWHSPETGEDLDELSGVTGPILCLATDPEGTRIAAGDESGVVRVWTTRDRREEFAFEGHRGNIESVCFSPDGRALASGCKDGTARLWDLAEGRTARTLSLHGEGVTAAVYRPDGRRVATASWDRTIGIWDPLSGELLYQTGPARKPILCLAYSPDSAWLAAGGMLDASLEPGVQFWETARRRELWGLVGHTRRIRSLAFHPSGNQLASASHDGTVRLWRVPPEAEGSEETVEA